MTKSIKKSERMKRVKKQLKVIKENTVHKIRELFFLEV